MKNKRFAKTMIAIIGSILVLLLLMPVLMKIVPDIYTIIKNEDYTQVETYLRSFGILGAFLGVAIQMMQVFSVIVPAPVIWISVGVVYGTFWGLLICTTGILLGNLVVFTLARRFKLRQDEESTRKSLGFLAGIRNPKLLILLMVLIPGFPNGIVPYIGAATNLATPNFLFLVAIGSIPSILLTGGIGDLFIRGNPMVALIACIVLLLAGGCFMLFKNKLITFAKRFDEKQK